MVNVRSLLCPVVTFPNANDAVERLTMGEGMLPFTARFTGGLESPGNWIASDRLPEGRLGGSGMLICPRPTYPGVRPANRTVAGVPATVTPGLSTTDASGDDSAAAPVFGGF